MKITATHISYLHTCRRKLWLFHQGIHMEHNSSLVYEGRLIGEMTYTDRGQQNRQIELNVSLGKDIQGIAVIDYFNPSTGIVHETKKSDKIEEAHVAQVKFYLYLLYLSGVHQCSGIIEYPKLRQRTQVPPLSEADLTQVRTWIDQVYTLITQAICPKVVHLPICKTCAYFEYCYADEEATNEPLETRKQGK